MTRERFVVIGADAAGMSAASEARRVSAGLEIVAFDRGGHASYSQCGMPYWIAGDVASRERLTARSLAGFEQFVGFLLSPTGRRILRLAHFDAIETPAVVGTGAPASLQPVPGR